MSVWWKGTTNATTKARRNRERVERNRHAEWEATKDENGFYGATPPSARKKAEKRTEQRMVSKQRERDGQALEEARLQELEEALENERVKWEKQEADQQQRERDDQALDEAGLQEVEQMYTQALEAAAKIRETCARELEEAEAQALPEEKQKEKQKTHTKVLPLVPIFRPEPTADAAARRRADEPPMKKARMILAQCKVCKKCQTPVSILTETCVTSQQEKVLRGKLQKAYDKVAASRKIHRMLRRRFGSSKEDWKEDLSDANEWKKIPEKHWLIALNKPLDEDMHKLYCTIPQETRMRLFDLCSGIMMNEEKEKREERERAEQSKHTWDALDATSTSPIVTAFRLQPSSRYAENETRNKVERMQWDLLTAREEMKEAQADEAPVSDDEVPPFPRLADCQTCECANDIKQKMQEE
jgi:hypothetical protein